MEDIAQMQMMEHNEDYEEEDDDEEGTFPVGSLDGVNKTALGQLLKRIRAELATLPEVQGMFQPAAPAQPSAMSAFIASSTLAPRNMTNLCSSEIIERCDEKPLWNALMGYGFLIVFCFALFGNCLNLLIYKSDHIRFFIAIRMLCTKLLMNTCMMVVMLPQALRVIRLWDVGGPMDQVYWRFWPYQAYLTNVFGFCAMWLTVLMTAECYIHIFFPGKSKLLCTKQTVWRSYFIILLAALVLASIYPLNRDVSLVVKCERKIVKIITSQHPLMIFFEKVHTIADLFLSILLPLSLLVFMTAMIVWRLWVWPRRHWRRMQAKKAEAAQTAAAAAMNGNGANASAATGLLSAAAFHERNKRENHFAAEKRGVTRITLITCFIQLVTETPSMSVLIYVSMFGPNVHKKEHICQWQTISYFLCLCNASLSFFVYITFSTRFRKTMINRARLLLHQLCPSIFPEVPSSSIGIRNSRHRLPNSSATPSQMLVLTSKENSPRNGSQCEGKHQKLLVVSTRSEPPTKSRSTTTLKDLDPTAQTTVLTPKLSSQNPPMCPEEFANISLAKRFLQKKFPAAGKSPLRKLESDSQMTETTNSLETLPPSTSGHNLAQQSNSVDSPCRPLSNSMNGRIQGNQQQQEKAMMANGRHRIGTDGNCHPNAGLANEDDEEERNRRRRREEEGSANAVNQPQTKRSSVSSTMTTNTNSQYDAFL